MLSKAKCTKLTNSIDCQTCHIDTQISNPFEMYCWLKLHPLNIEQLHKAFVTNMILSEGRVVQ